MRIRGRVFHKVPWMGVRYEGVVARYCEAGRVQARLIVLDDGTYRSDDARSHPESEEAHEVAAVPAKTWGRIALGVAGVLFGVSLFALLRGRGGVG